MSNRLKSAALGLVAYALGVFSVIWSGWLLLYFGCGFTYYAVTDPALLMGRSWRVVLFEWTCLDAVGWLAAWITPATAAGCLSYSLARLASPDRRIALAAAVDRLSRGAILGVALDLALVGSMFGYRLYRLVA